MQQEVIMQKKVHSQNYKSYMHQGKGAVMKLFYFITAPYLLKIRIGVVMKNNPIKIIYAIQGPNHGILIVKD